MIFDKVDRLAGVEQMCRDGMAHEMNVTLGRRKIGERGVAAKQGLDLACPETALAANEERRIVIAARGEVVAKWRSRGFGREASRRGCRSSPEGCGSSVGPGRGLHGQARKPPRPVGRRSRAG